MRTLMLAAALLLLAEPASADSTLRLAFTPDAARATGATTPQEGCFIENGIARGRLTASSAGTFCQSGMLGVENVSAEADLQASDPALAQFISDPFAHGLELRGPVSFHMNWDSDPGISNTFVPGVEVDINLAEVTAHGQVIPIGQTIHRLCDQHFSCWAWFNVGGRVLAPGSRILFTMVETPPSNVPTNCSPPAVVTVGQVFSYVGDCNSRLMLIRLLYGDRQVPGTHPYGSLGGGERPKSYADSHLLLTVADPE